MEVVISGLIQKMLSNTFLKTKHLTAIKVNPYVAKNFKRLR